MYYCSKNHTNLQTPNNLTNIASKYSSLLPRSLQLTVFIYNKSLYIKQILIKLENTQGILYDKFIFTPDYHNLLYKNIENYNILYTFDPDEIITNIYLYVYNNIIKMIEFKSNKKKHTNGILDVSQYEKVTINVPDYYYVSDIDFLIGIEKKNETTVFESSYSNFDDDNYTISCLFPVLKPITSYFKKLN